MANELDYIAPVRPAGRDAVGSLLVWHRPEDLGRQAPACSNFSIAGRYTEWLVLGAAAVHYDGKLMWNNNKGEFTNNKDATKWIKPTYRKGWEVKL